MKSRRNQIVLLVLVVLIWGLILYKFFSFTEDTFSDPKPIALNNSRSINTNDVSGYSYHLNYTDPFLKEVYPNRSNNKDQNQEPEPMMTRAYPFPTIQLIGIVSSKNRQTGIVKIQGRTHMVTKNDSVDGFFINDISNESIRTIHLESDSIILLTNKTILRD